MLTAEQRQSFRDNGFLNYGRVLTDEQLAELRAALDRVLAGKNAEKTEQIANLAGGGQVVTQVVNIWEAEPAFREHLSNAVIVPLVNSAQDDNGRGRFSQP